MSKVKNVRLRLTVLTRDSTAKTETRMSSVNPVLAPRGIKGVEFLRRFDTLVDTAESNVPMTVHVIAELNPNGRIDDYVLDIKTPSVSFLLKKLLGIDGFSASNKKLLNRSVTTDEIMCIAKVKQKDCVYISLKSVVSSICGTLRSIGLPYDDPVVY